MEELVRLNLMVGEQSLQRIKSANIAIFGIGGVGGYVCEMLARSGVSKLCIVDFDIIDTSNINRQIIALHSTVGKLKIKAMKNRIEDINPNCQVSMCNERINGENIDTFNIGQFDYVVDAIDDLSGKIAIAKECQKCGVRLISAMGAGNRYDIPEFVVKDIFDTSYDGLAKKMRKECRDNNITALNVVCAKSQALKISGHIGSVAYYPCACACVICAKIINDLIESKGENDDRN